MVRMTLRRGLLSADCTEDQRGEPLWSCERALDDEDAASSLMAVSEACWIGAEV